ncbi:uncharacterized protein LOC142578708 isoform X1 [Dermacentor variabilis]|uniref:uncharacterized protein LOC142578708 isoform X1 n=1 Tax=Dermacentor variabilis TaxID=34621 RepID=UPI003F5BD2DC
MAASEQATSEDGNLQPAAAAHSDAPNDNGVYDDSAAIPSSMQVSSSNAGERKDDRPQATKELDRVPLVVQTEQVPTSTEHCDDGELQVLLCLLEQRLCAPAPPTDEQNQQLWETLRSLVPKYKDRTRLMRQRITELQQRLEENQRESLHWREHHLEEHRQRLDAVIEDYERQHALALERASNARQQAESLLLQLADAQAQIKRLEAEAHTRTEKLKSDHLRELQALAEEKQAQLHAKSLEHQEEEASYKNLQQQNLAEKTKQEAEVGSLRHKNVELEGRLKSQEALNKELMSVLEKERNLNQELTVAMGQHEKKIAHLEHQVYKLQSEEKHKDMLIEVLTSKVSQGTTLGTDAPGGHQPLPQTVSHSTSPIESGSKADSGVQGLSSSSRSHEEVSVCSVALQVSPQEGLKLDQTLKDFTSQLSEKKAAVLQAKRLLRSTTNELQKLTKLAEERAEQLRRLQSRMQSTSTVASTPGSREYKASDDDACHVRSTSSGFVPFSAALPLSKTVRKVCYKKVAATPKESLSTLASVSSIQNNVESSVGPPHLELRLEEMSCVSDDVFESTCLREKCSAANRSSMSKAVCRLPQPLSSTHEMGNVETPHKLLADCFHYLKDESYVSDAVLKSHSIDDDDQRSERMFSFGCKQATSLLDQSSKAVTPIRTSVEAADMKKQNTLSASTAIEDKSPVQKTISRSPWEQDQCCGKRSSGHVIQSTPSYDFPLLGKSKVWNYVPCDCKNPTMKPTCSNDKSCISSVQKKGARRSLTFSEEGVCPTALFAHCSAGASDISLSVPQEHSFRGLPHSAPVNVTVHVQAYPESKGFHR